MKAGILTIGDEILLGQILNSNAQWLSQQLTQAGVLVTMQRTTADSKEDIMECLAQARKDVDLVIMTGGLGPTRDDVTKHALAAFFQTPLVFREAHFKRLEAIFAARKIPVSDSHRLQFMLPEAAITYDNHMGTAPGLHLSTEGFQVISLPGVPYEMESLMRDHVLPWIKQHTHQDTIRMRTFCTAGAGETVIADALWEFEDSLPGSLTVSYLPGVFSVRIRLTATETDTDTFRLWSDKLEALLKPWLFGYDNDTLESHVGDLLRQRGHTLATAESCTGGHLAHRITSVPGSSDYFIGTIVSYANHIKSSILGVSEADLRTHGAVSEQVAKAMASGARKLMHTDFAISTTGVAGPGGGSAQKPVGTVWIGIATQQGTYARRYIFGKDRLRNIQYTSAAALNALRKVLSAS